MIVIGNSFPDLTYGISNSLRYRNITFDVFFDGVQGIEMLNNNLVDTYFPIQLRRNKLALPEHHRKIPPVFCHAPKDGK